MTMPWLLFFFSLKQCHSKSSVATSSSHLTSCFMASYCSLCPKAWRETSSSRTPQSRLQHPPQHTHRCCLHFQSWSPLPFQQSWPKCLVFTGGRATAVWDWGGRAFREAQWRPRQEHLRGTAPQDVWRLMPKLLLMPHLHPPFFSTASFENHTSLSIALSFWCNHLAGQHQAPCLPLTDIAWYKQPLTEKEKERQLQKHKDVDGTSSSLPI